MAILAKQHVAKATGGAARHDVVVMFVEQHGLDRMRPAKGAALLGLGGHLRLRCITYVGYGFELFRYPKHEKKNGYPHSNEYNPGQLKKTKSVSSVLRRVLRSFCQTDVAVDQKEQKNG